MTRPTSLGRVSVLSLGGTIAMTGDAAAGVTPTLGASDLVAGLPVPDGVVVEVQSFRTVPGAHLRIEDLVALAAEIDRLVAGGTAGVVVTQGTDTIEETAFALDLLVVARVPVVVTGAMRNPTTPGADGPANLVAALLVACSEADLGGVVVVMGDEVLPARHTAKRHPTRLGAFEAPGAGPLGIVVEDRFVQLARTVGDRPVISTDVVVQAPVVPILALGLDDDGLLLRSAMAADGVVVETMGGGHVPKWVLDDLRKLAAQVPTIVTTRTRGGSLLRSTYGFEGSERDLRDSGALVAGTLDCFKARLVLLLSLRAGADRTRIAETLSAYEGRPEPSPASRPKDDLE